MKNIVFQYIIAFLLVLLISFLAGDFSKAQTITTVSFEKSGEVILNPGQGWILYGSPRNQSSATIDLGTTGYQRYDWCDINPAENVYNWSLIDDVMALWAQQGKQFSFGVMSVNTYGSVLSATPKWVFDKGAKYTMGHNEDDINHGSDLSKLKYYIPVWDDPVYVAECKKFAEVLAARYDGNPNVAFIDIRNYGNWGEMHMYPFADHTKMLTDERVQTLLLKPYIDSFKETKLELCWGQPPLNTINQWAVNNGIGLRNDGIMGNLNMSGHSGNGDVVSMSIGKEPIVWELLGTYKSFENTAGKPWDDNRFINIIKANKPNYIGMGQWNDDAQYMLSKKPDLVKRVANLMGYHFAITSARYTNLLAAGEAKEVTVFIENTGVTTMLTDCVIKLVLLNDKDEVVSSFTTDWDAKKFKASETTELKANVSFAGAPAGTYKLAIGLFLKESNLVPTYRMENKGRTKNGFYVIGDLKVSDQCKYGEYIDAAVGETNLCSGVSLLYNIPESVNINEIDAVIWKTNPSNAGIIKSVSGIKGSTATVEWNPDFRPAMVEIMYSIQLNSGSNCVSKPLIINLESENIRPPSPMGPTEIIEESTTIYIAEQDWTEYEWQISPATAGTIATDSNRATIHWAGGNEHSYVGEVLVSYRVTKTNNVCGISEFSPALFIDLLPKPPTPLENDPCAGTNTVFETRLYANASSYQWNIDPTDAGIITSKANTATINWLPSFLGQANVSYSVKDAAGRIYTSKPVLVNIQALPAPPNVADGPPSVDWDVSESILTADPDGGSYEWQISPSTAGSITTEGNSATIQWAGENEHSYAGQVKINYRISKAGNNCGFSEFSPALSIDLLPQPSTPSENNPCAGTSTVLETRLYEDVSYQWSIDPATAGTITSQANTAVIKWLSSFSGQVNVSYSVMDGAKRTYTSKSIPLNIRALPAPPNVAEGPPSVDWNVSESILTADPGEYSYEWQISPATAGNILTDGNRATIYWAGENEHSYAGQVEISYRIMDTGSDCGFSEFSPVLFIDLTPKPPTPLKNDPCAGTNTVFETRFYANASYQWSIDPTDAGTITSQANTATINWSSSFSGRVSVSYSVMDAEGRAYISESIPVNVQALPARPNIANGPASVDWDISESILTADSGGDRYDWQISPATAGTISTDGNSATIHWTGGNEHSYAGRVKISYRMTNANNNCGFSEFSPDMFIDLLPKPSTPSDINPCAGTSTVFETRLYEDVSYQWSIDPATAGTITSHANTATIEWLSSFSGQVNVSYSVMDAAERTYASKTVPVSIQALPAKPNMANGPSSVDWNVSESTFTADPGKYSYEWQISPATAGTITADGNSATVIWAGEDEHSYAGQVEISYRIMDTGDDCGFSEFSPNLSIELLPRPPMTSEANICAGNYSVFSTWLYANAPFYQWQISPANAGTITIRANTAIIVWSQIYSGPVNVSYSVKDNANRIYTSLPTQVTVQPLPAVPGIATGTSSVGWNEITSIFSVATQATTDDQGYHWSLDPAAGTISSSGNASQVTVTWNHLYVGTVPITYQAHNNCGWSAPSPDRLVTLQPTPPVIAGKEPCGGISSTVSAPNYKNAKEYSWSLEPANAGTITMNKNTATINWSQTVSGQASITYSVTNTADETYKSEPVHVTVLPLPVIPGIPTGPSSVSWDTPTSVITVATQATTDDQGYQWSLNPKAILSSSGNTRSESVSWDHNYVGIVQIAYRSHNSCGWSASSPALPVVLQPAPPEIDSKEPCSGTSSTVTAKEYINAKAYSWSLVPANAGTINVDANKSTITWSQTFSGQATVSYLVKDNADVFYTSPSIQVAVQPLPAVPGIATGPSSVNWDETVSDFAVAAQATSDQGYQWFLTPKAGLFPSPSNSPVTVTWDHLYIGTVQITYKAYNRCGWSASSPALPVVLQPAPPEIISKEPCSGSSTSVTAKEYINAKAYSWSLVPANAGTINGDANKATITWSQTFSGQVSVSYSVKDNTDGIYTSPKVQVNVRPLPAAPGIARGPSSVSWNTPTSVFAVATQATTDAQGYQWSLNPAAGAFSSSGSITSTTVTWNHDYVGTVQVAYKANNSCGWSASSPALPVVLQPTPPKVSDKDPCSGSSSEVSAPDYQNAGEYSWNLLPANAGSITKQERITTINWSPTFSGQASVSYSVADATGKVYASSRVQVTVQPLPVAPGIARGPSSVSWNETVSTFSVAAQTVTDELGYQWYLNPMADILASPGNTSPATVTWNHLYVGTVHVAYKAHNHCGWSASSPALPVVLQPTPPEISDKEPCAGTSTTVSAPIYQNAKVSSWNLNPTNAGTITYSANTATINWSRTFSGQANVSYSVTDAAGGIYTSPPVQVDVQSLPAVPGIATGPSSVSWGTPTSVFTVTAQTTTDDQGYQWSLNPMASTLPSLGNTSSMTVTWNHDYVGTVWVAYKTHNHCGWSASSPTLPVVLQPTPPEISDKEPCSGSFSTASAPIYQNAKGYTWSLTPANAGAISGGGNQANISWNPLFVGGLATVEYTVTVGTERYSSSTQVNIQPLPVNLPQASGNIAVAYSESTTVYTASNGWREYRWEISPAGASTSIQVNGNRLSASWNKKYVGKVNISYKVQNACGWSPNSSPALIVTLLPAPPVIDPSEVCNSSETAVSASLYQNASVYQWHISPSDAGQMIGSGHQAIIHWNNLYTGEAAISYTVVNSAQESYPSSQVSILVKEVLTKPSIASGPDKVYLNYPLTTYQATSAGVQYDWMVTPSQAAEVQNPTSVTTAILWGPTYYGEAKIEYRIGNECGWSEISDPLVVQVYQSDLSGDIPGIFTPNGDGFNDTWDIPAINQYPEAMIRIYNRAKKLMVEFKGAQLPWDGRNRNGNILESGYYLYQIELKKGGKIVSGYVTILH